MLEIGIFGEPPSSISVRPNDHVVPARYIRYVRLFIPDCWS